MKQESTYDRTEKVIESVGAKKAAMRQWESEWDVAEERRKIRIKRWRTYGISAAASVAVICVVGLGIHFSLSVYYSADPSGQCAAPMYRGGSRDISEIQEMMTSGRYDEALDAIEVTLADTVIDPTYPEDRQEYLRSLNANREYELTWLKINVLLKSDSTDKAITLLKDYVDLEGTHQEDAGDLLQKLTR